MHVSQHAFLVVHIECFLSVLEHGSTVLCKKHVLHPLETMDVSRVENVIQISGFNGRIGFSDGAHSSLVCCLSWTFNNQKGFKLAAPSRNFNAAVTH